LSRRQRERYGGQNAKKQQSAEPQIFNVVKGGNQSRAARLMG
jgi:hypothetical protein